MSALTSAAAEIGTTLSAILLALTILVLQSTNSSRSASGYVWAAVVLSKGRILAWIAIKTILAIVLLHAFWSYGTSPSLKFLLALLLTIAPEQIRDLAETIGNEKVARFAFIAMQKTNFSVIQLLDASITRLREHANYDWQNSHGQWRFEVNAQEIGRRIRILYERNKREIANSQRKPRLLAFDVGIVPAQKFYLLIDFFGPKRLHQALRECSADAAIPPTFGWDGSERRRSQTTESHPTSRPIDDAQLRELILHGQAFPAYNTSPTAPEIKRTKKA